MANLADSGLAKLCVSYVGVNGELQVMVRIMPRADLEAIVTRIGDLSHG